MYIINEKAGQAAKAKGFAAFPDDFERLPKTSGAAFVWWRDGDNIKIETTLNGDDLKAELKSLKKELDA